MQGYLNQTIKGYQVQQLIGSGGFGAVYRAYQAVLEREVAIKVIHKHYVNQPDFIRRFEVEARMVASLEHLHIVPLYDYWRDVDGAYLVMRYLRGHNLRVIIGPDGLPLLQAARLLEQIGAALATAHRQGVIHRDIKPDNLLLDEEGNAYLTDFGIATRITSASAQAQTEKGSFGSPPYISPEAILGEPMTPTSDIYSLGIMLYEMLTGHLPFVGPSPETYFDQHLSTPMPSLSLYRHDLPVPLDAVIWRAAAKTPDVRYPAIADFVAAFFAATNLSPVFSPVTVNPVMDAIPVGVGTLPLDGSIPLRNPYKGLRPFDEIDAQDFFGREALLDDLIKRLASPTGRFLALIGPSGSGKSSVVKAGLIPCLRTGQIEGASQWLIAQIVPDSQPSAQLQEAIGRIASRTTQLQLQPHTQQADDLHRLLLASVPESSQVLLVIDQFEELFTLTDDEAERRYILENLAYAVTQPQSRLRLIVTLRADFYDRPLYYPSFGELLRQQTAVLLPMSPDELSRAILQPAHRAHLTLEPALLASLLTEVSQQPGALPLLQYTLAELFEQRDGPTLTLASHQRMGGVVGSLASRAEALYTQLDAPQQAAIRQLLLQLVQVGEEGEPTRRRALQSDLIAAQPDREVLRQVLSQFSQARLLTFDRDPASRTPTVEVAHEALLRAWSRLGEWISTNREEIALTRRLVMSANEWEQSKQEASYLASGARLVQFEALAQRSPLTPRESRYVAASTAQARRNQRRAQVLMASLVILTLLAFAFAGVALNRQAAAGQARDRANQQAQVARSRALALTALSLQPTQPDLALLLSLEARQASNTFEARSSLLTLLQAQGTISAYLHGPTAPIRTLAYSPTNQLLAVNGQDNSLVVWDLSTGLQQPPSLWHGHSAQPNALAFSTEGHWLASGDLEGRIWLWQDGERQPTPLTVPGQAVWSVAFSPDGQTLAAGYADGTIRLWDIQNGQARLLEGHSDIVYAVRFSPDGKQLASGAGDSTAILWDTATGEPLSDPLVGHQNWVLTLAYSPNGQLLASSGADSTIILWDAVNARQLIQFPTKHQDWVRQIAISPDGRQIVTASADHTSQRWDIGTGQAIGAPLAGHSEAVWGVAFIERETGLGLLSGGQDGKVILWDVSGQLPLAQPYLAHAAQVNRITLRPDGQQLASVSGGATANDNSLRLWEADSMQGSAPLTGQGGPITGVAYSPDGRWIATSSADGTILLRDSAEGQPLGEAVRGHLDIAWAVAFNPNGQQLASVGEDRRIQLWALPDLSPTANWEALSPSLSLAWQGDLVVTGGRDGVLRWWSASQQLLLHQESQAHQDAITALTFSPDGRLLVSVGRDGLAQLWRVSDYQADGTHLGAGQGWLLEAAFSPDGRLLATGSNDNTITLWDMTTRQALGQPLSGHTNWVTSLVFSLDGQRLVSAGMDQRLLVWAIGESDLERRACYIANRTLSQGEWERYMEGLPYQPAC
jgi:WD40 repeat protein/serine/threonine protein kinase